MANERLGASFSIDVTDLKTGLAQANRMIRESESEFKAAAAGMDDWRKSEEGLNAKIKSLNDITEIQRKKVDALKEEYQNLIDDGLDPASREATELRTKINNEEAALKSNEKALEAQQEALENVGEESEETGDKFEKLGKVASAAGKVAAAAFAAAAAAVGSLLKQSIESYAEYEQLVGGVETLFSASAEEASKSIEKFGKKAVETMSDEVWESIGNEVYNNAKQFKSWENDVGSSMDAVADGLTFGLGTSLADVDGFVKHLTESYGMNIKDAETMADAVSKAIENNVGKLGDYAEALNGPSEAAKKVVQYANEAYKTAGMSANKYMETVTSFSASLIAGLGGNTELAADIANKAIVDMSDNANKMGTDISSIQNAYQGFAKQNYTMLDNLKLGYGGTQAEMARLINDSGVLGDTMTVTAENVNSVSFDKIIEAIHVVQDNLGITGATAREASTTIQGSISAMKASWTNLMTGMSDETADFDQLISNFIESVGTVAENLLPRVGVALEGVIKLVEGLVPLIPPLISKFLPVLIDGIMNLLAGVVEILPTIIDAILVVIPNLMTALVNMLPTMVSTIAQIIVQIIQAITKMIPQIVENIMLVLPQLVHALVEAIPQLIEAAIQFLLAIVQAVPQIIPPLIEALPDIINTIITVLVDAIPQVIDGAIQLLMAILDALPVIIDALIDNLPQIIEAIVTGLITGIDAIIQGAIKLFMAILEAIPEIVGMLIDKMPEIIDAIVTGLSNGWTAIKDVGANLIEGLWEGIKSMGSWIYDQISSFASGIVDGFCDFFGISSPSKLMEDMVGKNIALGIGVGFEDNIDKVNKQISDAIQIDDVGISAHVAQSGVALASPGGGRTVTIYQTNNYSQAHSRYEIYKSKQQTAAAVQLALAGV